ncbi:MAG: aldo/keto reductase [Azospirillaceae bacterium]|nr:aldo/keto reductase [Azospirillaceae bacterium]
MELRKLGNTGLTVAPLAFGGNVFGWTVDEATSFSLLDAFVAEGFNLIDTADVYSRWVPGNQGGESEAIIGRWLKSRGWRDRVVIATKVGMDMGADGAGLSQAHIINAVERSLSRLQTDVIDLYQSHRDDAAAPLDETLGAYARLIEQGKVRAIGASNYEAARLDEALKVSRRLGYPRYETLQPHYNLIERAGFEGALEALCLQQGIGVITYYSLAAGFLTGKYRSVADLGQSPRGARAQAYLTPRGFGILHALDAVAERYGATVAQIALAWLIARPAVTAPIVSATRLSQLEDLIDATRIHLDRDAIAQLDAASA